MSRWATIDESFFDEWRPEMAWVLGLLYTDGSIRTRTPRNVARLTFSQKSPELLEKVCALVRSDTVIHYNPRRIYNGKIAGAVYKIQIANAKVCRQLVALGMTPRKSLTMRVPAVPADCARHFIRGCWDGDGSFYWAPNRRQVVAKFGCGSRAFVEGMLEVLYQWHLPQRHIYRLRRRGQEVDYYYFVLQRNDDTERLFRMLYEAVPPSMYLSRKHAILAEHFSRVAAQPELA